VKSSCTAVRLRLPRGSCAEADGNVCVNRRIIGADDCAIDVVEAALMMATGKNRNGVAFMGTPGGSPLRACAPVQRTFR
jgi:hypothetical protein